MQFNSKRRKSSNNVTPCCTSAVSLQKAVNELSVYKDLYRQSSYHMYKAKVKMMGLKKSLKKSLKLLNEVFCSLDWDFENVPRFSATPCSHKNEKNPVSKVTDEVWAEENLTSDSESDSDPVKMDEFVSQTANVKGSIDTMDSKDEKKSSKLERENKRKLNSLTHDVPNHNDDLTYIVADSCKSIIKKDNLKVSTHFQLNGNNSKVNNKKSASGAVSLHMYPLAEPSPKKIKKSILNESSTDNEMLINNSKSNVDSDIANQTVIETVEQATETEVILDDDPQKNERSGRCEPTFDYNILSMDEKELLSENVPPKITPVQQSILNNQRKKMNTKKTKKMKKICLAEIAQHLNKNIPLDDLLPKHLRCKQQ